MRLDIGGKLLTNYLKESLSYRQLNLMDEFMVTEQIKEAACYSTLDYKKDMQNKQLNKLFILPGQNVYHKITFLIICDCIN